MALVVKDRVRETSTTTGTGTLTLAGAVSGFQTFSSAIGNTNTTYYTIINGTEWETGLGTVAAGTLARTTVLESSNAGSTVNFTAGTKDVFGTYPASKALYKDASGNAIGLGTVAATTTLTSAVGLPLSTGVTGTLPIANGGTGTTATAHTSLTTNVTGTLPVANGGTSLATLTANNVLLGNGTSAPTFVAPSTSGNLLTSNGTTWVSSTPATPNTAGGATTVSQGTSLTLTSASNRVQNVTLTAGSLSVTLPDATTLSAGGPVYIITNTGAFTFDVKQNGGAPITCLLSGQSVELKLMSIATAAGTWNTSNLDISQILPASQYAAVQVDTNAIAYYSRNTNFSGKCMDGINNTNIDILKVSSTTAIMTWVRASNNSVYGAILTNTSGTITVGTIVQLYDGSVTATTNFNTQLLTGLTTGMCFVSRASTAVAIPFSISGTTITVGTSSATFGFYSSVNNNAGRIVEGAAVMSSTVILISYMSVASTTFVVNTITYNGASAPTLGTATATITFVNDTGYFGGFGPANLANLTATTAQLWYWSTVTNLATRIVTLNGILAPTLGTALNTTTSSRDDGPNTYQIFVNSATETAIRFGEPYPTYQANLLSFAISGTTVTLQNTSSTTLLMSSVPVTTSAGAGLYISDASEVLPTEFVRNLSKTGIYKYNFVTGTNVFNYASATPALPTYAALQSVAVLSATTGIVVGYSPTYMPYANAININ